MITLVRFTSTSISCLYFACNDFNPYSESSCQCKGLKQKNISIRSKVLTQNCWHKVCTNCDWLYCVSLSLGVAILSKCCKCGKTSSNFQNKIHSCFQVLLWMHIQTGTSVWDGSAVVQEVCWRVWWRGGNKGDGICYRNRQLKCMLHHPPTQWLVIVVKMYNDTTGVTPPPRSPSGFAAQCVTFDSPVYKVYIYHHISLNKVLFKTNKQTNRKTTTKIPFQTWTPVLKQRPKVTGLQILSVFSKACGGIKSIIIFYDETHIEHMYMFILQYLWNLAHLCAFVSTLTASKSCCERTYPYTDPYLSKIQIVKGQWNINYIMKNIILGSSLKVTHFTIYSAG